MLRSVLAISILAAAASLAAEPDHPAQLLPYSVADHVVSKYIEQRAAPNVTARARGRYVQLGNQAVIEVSAVRAGSHRNGARDANQTLQPHSASLYTSPGDGYDMQMFWSSGEWDFAIYLAPESGLSRAAKIKLMKRAFADAVKWTDAILSGTAGEFPKTALEQRLATIPHRS